MKTSRSLARAAALSLAAAGFFAAPALTQRAPVVQGATSGENAVLRQQTAEMRVEINGLRADLASVNGEVETLEFLLNEAKGEIDRLRDDDKEIADLIRDLEAKIDAQSARINTLEAQLTEVASAPTAGAFTAQSATTDAAGGAISLTPPPNGADTGEAGAASVDAARTRRLGTLPASSLPGEAGPLFADAKSKLLQFDYAGAEAAFRAFLDRFGDDAQAGEAQYWLGEVLYQQEAYAESGQAYTEMIRKYPEDARAPDALVKLARSMRLVGNPDAACAALDTLPKRYPEASGVTRNLAAVERARSACDA